MQIELNDQEAQALTSLIDLAIKTGGLAVAEAGLVLAKRIQDAKNAETTVEKTS